MGLERFFDLAKDMLATLSLKGEITLVNDAWTRALGWSSVSLLSRPLIAFVHEHDRNNLERALTQLAGGQPQAFCRVRCLHLNRSWRPLDWSLHLDGDTVYAQARETAEIGFNAAALTGTAAFLRRVVNHLPLGVFCKDSFYDFRFVIWNKTCHEWWGISEDEALGKSDYDLFPKDQADAFRRMDQEVMTASAPVDIAREKVQRPDFYVRTVKVPLPDETGRPRYLLGISENISERVRVETMLAAEHSTPVALDQPLAQLALQAHALHGLLLANASHGPEAAHLAATIGQAADKAAELFRGLLEPVVLRP